MEHHLPDGYVERMGEYKTMEGALALLPGFGEGTEADVGCEHDTTQFRGAHEEILILKGGAIVGLGGQDIYAA